MAGSKKTASKAPKSTAEIAIGSTVLLKVKGYPEWPGKVVSEEDLTPDVLKDKPSKADVVCVRFYPKGDFSWGRRHECKVITKADIETFIAEPHRKGADLMEGYKIALSPAAWEADLAARHRAFEESMEGVDELEDDDEDDVGTASGAKKRKKAPAAAREAKGKKAKVEKKPKATTSKKASKVKSNPNIESEEEAEPAKPSKAAGKKAADDLDADSAKVKDWRHKLQRAFLGKAPPAEKDMPNCDQYFTTIEAYDDMTIEQLQASKIGKVMRKIQALDAIPRDEDFHFKERAKKLMDKWQTQLNKAGATEDAAPASATNGAPASDAAPAPAAAEEAKAEVAAPAAAAAADEKKAEEEEEKPAPAEEAPKEDEKAEEAAAAPADAAADEKAAAPAADAPAADADVEMAAPEAAADGEKDAEGEPGAPAADAAAAPAESS